jgi:hypothetical protein
MKYNTFFSILFLLFLTIILVLVSNHYFQNIENAKISTLENWSKVSDFFGGIINTIISFFSLIILTVITLVVSNQSNSENKKINLLLKRIDSYDKLANYFPKLILSSQEFKISSEIIKHKVENKIPNIEKEVDTFSEHSKIITEIFSFIVTFGLSYGHLYKYNFNSKDYNDLISISEKVNRNFNIARQELTFKTFNFQDVNLEHMNELVYLFQKILNQLRTELK